MLRGPGLALCAVGSAVAVVVARPLLALLCAPRLSIAVPLFGPWALYVVFVVFWPAPLCGMRFARTHVRDAS